MSKKSICAVLLVAGAVAFAGPSLADKLTVTAGAKSAPVSYTDLDVRTADGARELIARVKTAAGTLCKAQTTNDADFDMCVVIAVDNAVAQVAGPMFADASEADMQLARVGD